MRPLRTRLAGALLSVLALTLTTTACGEPSGTGSGTTADGTDGSSRGSRSSAPVSDRLEPLAGTPSPELPVTVRSADGRKVTVERADRLVPLSGSLSEIVFTLGLGDRVVARDVTATFEEASELPVVTRGHDVSAESVLSLRPDLVIAEATTGPAEAMDQIRAAGIRILVVGPAAGLDDVGPRIRAVADALGVPDAGGELTTRSEQRIDAVGDSVPDEDPGPGSPSSICAAPPPCTSSAAGARARPR